MKLRYFAWVRERVGKPEEDIEVPAGVATVAELMRGWPRAARNMPMPSRTRKSIRAAIDRSHVQPRPRSPGPQKSPFSRR